MKTPNARAEELVDIFFRTQFDDEGEAAIWLKSHVAMAISRAEEEVSKRLRFQGTSELKAKTQ